MISQELLEKCTCKSSPPRSKANCCRKMFRDNIEKPKDFRKQIKRSYPSNKKSPTSNVFSVEGELVSDKKKISNGFCSFFTNIWSSLQRDASRLNSKTWQFFNGKPISTQINPKCNEFKFRTIKLNEITTALRSIKVSKSAGPDNLAARLIRDGAEQIAAILYFLANQSLRSESFPNNQKCARLTPIYKSGARSNFDNYRPISVLNILSKVLEGPVHRHLSEYLERNNLLSCSQFGFRRERSTQHAVTLFTEHIRNRCTGALFMDLSKASDTVHHGTLL